MIVAFIRMFPVLLNEKDLLNYILTYYFIYKTSSYQFSFISNKNLFNESRILFLNLKKSVFLINK